MEEGLLESLYLICTVASFLRRPSTDHGCEQSEEGGGRPQHGTAPPDLPHFTSDAKCSGKTAAHFGLSPKTRTVQRVPKQAS